MTAVATRAEVGCSALLSALQFVTRSVPSRTTLPVLECVHMRLSDDGLTLTATDMDRFARSTVPAEGAEDAALCVPARELLELVGLLSGDTVGVELDAGRITLHASDGKHVILGTPAEEFPKWPEIDTAAAWEIPRELVARLAKEMTPFISVEESRPTLCSVLWTRRADAQVFVATTGHVMGKIEAPAHPRFPDAEMLMLPGSLALAAALPGTGPLKVARDKRSVGFFSDTATVVVRTIEGAFPNYEKLIPTDHDKTAVVNKKLLEAAVKRAMVFRRAETKLQKLAVFGFEDDRVNVNGSSRDRGHGDSMVPLARYEGEPLTIGFNGAYVLSALAIIPGDAVRITMKDAVRATIWCADVEAPDHMVLVMPLRIE